MSVRSSTVREEYLCSASTTKVHSSSRSSRTSSSSSSSRLVVVTAPRLFVVLSMSRITHEQGRRHGFESGPPHFLASGGGDKILLR